MEWLKIANLAGADGTNGTPGPPGAVPTTSDWLVSGPGRPDQPATTGMSSGDLAALPVGCEYRSTDGSGVGAWVWRKRPAGWVVVDGDTGWISVGISPAVVYLKRVNDSVTAFMAQPSGTAHGAVANIPAGFQSLGPWGNAHANGTTVGHAARTDGSPTSLYFKEPAPTQLFAAASVANTRGWARWETTHAWPTTITP